MNDGSDQSRKPPMTEIFHFEDGKPSFEDMAVRNGTCKWREIDVQNALGYTNQKTFREAVRRAQQACLALKIDITDHFCKDGEEFKFTRFACYLIAMNGDAKKVEVAAAQAYFATIAETFQNYVDHVDGVDRVIVRDDLTVGTKSLASAAKQQGVENYAFFCNEGYRGMYNMGLRDLKRAKGIGEKDDLLDRMGRQELAANLFRVTQTEEKIRTQGIMGQRPLEQAAFDVGQTVRKTMIQISGKKPEALPLSEPIGAVRSKLKSADKRFKQLDAPKKKAKKKPSNETP